MRPFRLSVCALLFLTAVVCAQSPPREPERKPDPDEVTKKDEAPPSPTPAAKKAPVARAEALRRVLAMSIEVPGQQLSVRDLFHVIGDQAARRGELFEVYVDQAGISMEKPDAQDLLDVTLVFPPQRRLTVQQLLEQIAAQSAAQVEVTYLIRQGRIEIVPVEFARIDRLLDRGVTVQFRNTPVAQALEELSDASGVTVAVDPRCGDALHEPFTLRAGQDMSVRGILECLADMYELRLTVDEHRVFLTTEAAYLKRMRTRIDEAKLKRELGPAGVSMLPGSGLGGMIGGEGGMIPLERPRQMGRRLLNPAGGM